MKVAHVASYRPDAANGALSAAARLGAALIDQGVEVEFWHLRRGIDRISEREEPSGVRVIELPFPGVSRSRLGYVRWLPSRSRRWIEERASAVSLLHFHSIFQPDAWFISSVIEKPYVTTPHGGYVRFQRDSWKRWARLPAWLAFERRFLEGAALVHAVSPHDADSVRELAPTATVVVIPNGVDLPEDPPAQVVAGSPWLYIGRLAVADKGLDVLIDGYAEASNRAALPKLILRGPDYRGGRSWLENRVARHGVQARVEIGDAVFGDAKAELLGGCSLFIHTSRTEGLPVALLEAMAHSRPIAVTPGTNMVEPVSRSGAGVVISASTTEDVAAALLHASALSPIALAASGDRGLALVKREYVWSAVAAQVVAAYRSLTHQPGSVGGRQDGPAKPPSRRWIWQTG